MIAPGLYRGSVEGSESGHCEARILVTTIPGGVAVDYEAVGADGLQHVEHTLVMPGRLYVAHSESPVVTVFEETAANRFVSVPGSAPYSMGIEIGGDASSLIWTWSWAAPGEPLVERSRATVMLA